MPSATLNQPSSNDRVAPGAAPAVEVRGLVRSFDERAVLRGVDLTVEPGALVALVGANGAGKSTLLSILATLLSPDAGSVRLLGQDVRLAGPALRAQVGLIAHQSMLYRDLSLHENLSFFARLYGVRDREARIGEMLERVGLADRRDDAVKTLSRGMVQRAAWARALLHRPALLLADEPFAGLDPASTQAAAEMLTRLAGQGVAVVFSNHDLAQTLALAGRVVVLAGGVVSLDAPASALDRQAVNRHMGAA